MIHTQTSTDGLILFAHGSRNHAWRLPFETMLLKLKIAHPTLPCGLAFLELMQPDFKTQVNHLVEQGVRHIKILPLFFATGKHLAIDLPAFIDEAIADYQIKNIDLTFTTLPVVGEIETLQDAIVQIALTSLK